MKKAMAAVLALCMMICTSSALAVETGDEVIVGVEGFKKISGTWISSDNDTGIHYNNNGIYASAEGEAEISGEIPEDGCYELLWFYSGLPADSGSCTISFDCAEGYREQVFNVTENRGWVSLGKYDYTAGTNTVNLRIIGQSRFSGLKWKYAGINITVSSKLYTVNSAVSCITGIPYGTDKDELLANVTPINGMTLSVTDIDGNEKDGIIEDGDRLLAEYEGETYEYYLKTFAKGMHYSESFNYKSYEEYKKLQNVLNKSGTANEFMNEDIVEPKIVDYNGSKALGIEPKRKDIPQSPRLNFINFEALGGMAIVEYDVTQIKFPAGSAWIDIGAKFTGAPNRPDGRGYALWSGNLNGRGTLMRNSSYGARWLSLDGKKLEMQSEKTYHVRQMLDFNGNVETYVDGFKANVTNESITSDVSKSMEGFEAINGLGIGVYLEKKNWTNSNVNASAVFDNIKVYNPVEYIEYLIDRLPDENQSGGYDVIAMVELARKTLDSLVKTGINENEISNLEKLVYWEEQATASGIKSDIYDVENNLNIISGVIRGQTVNEFLEYVSFANGSTYEIAGKGNESVIENGDILTVVNSFGEKNKFTIEVNRDIAVKEYVFDNNLISEIPYGTAVKDFLENIVYPKSAEIGIYSGEEENINTVLDGDVLKIKLNGTELAYNISVIAVSGENYVISAGNYTVTDNEISGIPYNKSFEELKKEITVSKYASVSYPYADDYTGAVSDGDIIKVTAQNGDVRLYTLIVNRGNNTSELTGEGNIRIENTVVYGVDKGMEISQLLKALKTTNGGTVKIYSNSQNEIKAGKITGTETVRVYPEDSMPGKPYDIYTISCNKREIMGEEVIVTIEDEGFSYTGEKITSGSAVELGYNGITTVYINGGNAVFRPQINAAGDYNVYVYTAYHSSNKECPATISYNGGTAEAVIPQDQPSGWKLLGSYNFAEGTDGYVECGNNTGGGFGRYSAVKFEKCGEFIEIENVKAVLHSESTAISEGVNNIGGGDIRIEFSSKAVIVKEDIKLISDNGNETEFTFNSENGVYTIAPKYGFRENVTYYLSIDSDKISKPYSYVLMGKNEILEANARIVYCNADGIIVSDAAEADSVQVKLNILNTSDETVNAKLLICCYSKSGMSQSSEMISLNAGELLKINRQTDIQNSVDNVKVFLWQEDVTPITGVYYIK